MHMQVDKTAVWRLEVVTDADPGALVRVLQIFQTRNFVPQHVAAWRSGADLIEIVIEVESDNGLSDALRIVAAKIDELPVVLSSRVALGD
jgi:hypothetical protein